MPIVSAEPGAETGHRSGVFVLD